MFGKKVIFTSLTRQKNNQSKTGQNNLFWDNLFSTCQPTITDPVLQIFRSKLHRALRSEPFFSILLPMERPGLWL